MSTGIDIVALAGIAGTLLGAGLGAYISWKVQRLQVEHEDRTRFHDQRLTVYAAFNDACQRVVAAITVGGPYTGHQAEVVKSFEMLRLIASKSVSTPAILVHGTVGAFTTVLPSSRTTLTATYNAQMAALCIAMRAEIDVEKK